MNTTTPLPTSPGTRYRRGSVTATVKSRSGDTLVVEFSDSSNGLPPWEESMPVWEFETLAAETIRKGGRVL